MVTRQPHEGDRRSFEVKLLDEGHRVVEEINQITTRKLVPLMTQFSKEEKVQLLDYLQRIVKYTLADENNTDLICLQCGGKCGINCAVESGQGICIRPKKN